MLVDKVPILDWIYEYACMYWNNVLDERVKGPTFL
jgi:hypothetical protein